MANSTKNPNRDLGLLAFVMVLIGGGSVYFYFLPQLIQNRTTTATLTAQEAGLSQDIQTLTSLQAQIKTATDNLAAQGVDLSKVSEVYPATEDVPNLYLQMEKIVASPGDGVQKVTYTIGQPVDSGAQAAAAGTASTGSQQSLTASIPVTFSASGSYASLKSFLQLLETNIRPITLTTVSLKADSTGGSYTVNAQGFVRAAGLSNAYKK